jgi:peptidyl-prolyl cis-trans isomerase SurA
MRQTGMRDMCSIDSSFRIAVRWPAMCAAATALMLAPMAGTGAQQPAPAPAQKPDTAINLDRIVALVGDQPITQYDLQERVLAMRQQPGFRAPTNEAEMGQMAREVLNQLIDEEVLVLKAQQLKIEIQDAELAPSVEKQLRDIRSRFTSDAEYRAELVKAGLGSPEEYRRFLIDQMRRGELQRRVISQLRQEGKIPPANVTPAQVEEAFNRSRGELPRRPATVTFRQIIVTPTPREAAKVLARAKAESLLAEIKRGTDFERVAKRESADSASREQGGDLGWNRRGRMVPEFESWMFGLRPGDLSPVVETAHGYHIIRVDRVQPGEVKSRHILIKPVVDSLDDQRARAKADSVAEQWKAGVPFDTLVKRYHDPLEETSILTPIARDTALPPSYREAFQGKKSGDLIVFPIAGVGGHPKFVVAQLASVDEGGEYTFSDLRTRVRQQLAEEGSIRRFLDGLRKEFYVSIRADGPVPTPP